MQVVNEKRESKKTGSQIHSLVLGKLQDKVSQRLFVVSMRLFVHVKISEVVNPDKKKIFPKPRSSEV